MNCREFEPIVTELATNRLLEAKQREQGLAHSKDCQNCANRLVAEQQLQANLKQLAASTADLSAPPRLKQALLASFQQQQQANRAEQTASTVVKFNSIPRRRYYGWSLAASVLLMLCSAIVYYWLTARSDNSINQTSQVKSQPVLPTPAPTPSAKPIEPSPTPLVSNQIADDQNKKPDAKAVRVAHRVDRKPAVKNNVVQSTQEVVTDFIPLAYGGDPSALEGGQLVRVTIPRSMLSAWGLTVNADHNSEYVKADLVVGDDGLAQAIRFVY